MITSSMEPLTVKVVLVGMRCAFTAPMLDALCAAPDIDVLALMLPGVTPVDSSAQESVLDTVRTCGVSQIGIPTRAHLADPAFRATLEGIAPDVIVVACFPWRLPRWLLDLPRNGCLNLHPSLLPEGRGPDPIFWAFHQNRDATGVTLHLMDDGFDTGPIVAQVSVPIPDDATIPSLERSLAEIGAGLVLDHLRTREDLVGAAKPQREEVATYAPVPREDDLLISTAWSAAHAARFVRAVTPTYGAVPVLVLATGQRILVDGVMSIEGEGEGDPVCLRGARARVRFVDGFVTCRLAHTRHTLRIHHERSSVGRISG